MNAMDNLRKETLDFEKKYLKQIKAQIERAESNCNASNDWYWHWRSDLEFLVRKAEQALENA